MATTANGLIAKENGDVAWLSPDSWKSYQGILRKTRAVIIGRNTYKAMPRREFLKECHYVVLTHRAPRNRKSPNVIFVSEKPAEVIKSLAREGFKTVCIAGGGKLNASFMKENLIDEMYLDMEPILFGTGIRLFFPAEFENKLQLIGVKKLNRNTVQVHYRVKKQPMNA